MPSEGALERVARVIDLIPYLQHRTVNLKELAEHLGKDVADIERDLEVAFLCGLPGYTPDLLIDLTMEEGFVAVTDPQSLDIARRLTTDELTSLRLGIELILVQYASTPYVKALADSLRRKINGSTEDSRVVISEDSNDHDLAMIESAILAPTRISFSYVDSLGRVSHERTASPRNLLWRGGRLLLRAFDHDKGSSREFFVAQMKDVRCVEGEVVILEGVDPSPASNTSSSATVHLRSLPMWWKRRNSAFITELEMTPSGARVTLRYWNQEWLVSALVPVIDLIVTVDAEGLETDQLRSLFLSHFSATDDQI